MDRTRQEDTYGCAVAFSHGLPSRAVNFYGCAARSLRAMPPSVIPGSLLHLTSLNRTHWYVFEAISGEPPPSPH